MLFISSFLSVSIPFSLYAWSKVFSMKEIHAEPPFPCDYVKNGYHKREITSTAESKRVFFFLFFVLFFKPQTAHWKWRLTSNVVSAINWSGYIYIYIYIYIYVYIYNSLNTLSGGKSCLVAPGVAVPPWATETVLSAWLAADEVSVSHVLLHVVW